MPTNDDSAPPPRPSRRTLGRGPGAAPTDAGSDRPTAPPSPQTASQRPAAPPPEPTSPLVPGEPQKGAQAAHEATAGPFAVSEAGEAAPGTVAPEAEPEAGEAAPEGRAAADAEPEADEAAPERSTAPDVEPEPPSGVDEPTAPVPAATEPAAPEEQAVPRGEPEPVHARADLDVAPSGGGHGGDAAGAGSDASDGTEASGGSGRGEARGGEVQADDGGNRFTVRLDNFEGPFDLLLQLISKHKLDVTEVALSKVTDEFMVYIRAMGPDWDLDQTTEFLVVAATLLDLKAARLLPAAEVEDEADLALLEARDLLFARLLQYRAYKQIADIFNDRLIAESARYPRTVGLEPHHAALLPDVVISIGPEGFAKLAVKAMQAKPKPQVYIDHIHAPLVSVREQAEVVVARLRELGEATFSMLTEDAPDVLTVVARFLALLELYRERAVLLDQPEALGSLMVRWTGGAGREPLVTDEFDQEAQAKPQPKPQDEPQAEPQDEPRKETATPEPEKEKEEVPS
ncbi:segregation and condensation protein A [Streptomyces violaceusniger]|uniref:Segregation and condensation protein A n=1 Tax=Streptomyces violaceusniger (strain Tu 4113) TaxID=653045 RepID=G2P0L1_STRV4|nr:ScpA family protein [Streptomyces violaceusniger]AEM86229.1 chromosome segregation and condensation protein ScpA [Streptomyces violaceusniger Tu 4113]